MSQSNDLLDVLYRIKDGIVALDNKCNITYANQAYADIFGLKTSQLIGKNVWELFPKAVGSILYTKIMEAIKIKEFQRFEWQGLYANRIWETTVFPSDKGITALNKDITERKKAEEALNHSNERLKLISTIANQLLSNTKPQTLIQEICEKVMAFLNCDVFFNFLVDKEKQQLHLNAYAGIPVEEAKKIEWQRLGEAVYGCAVRDAKRIVCENISLVDDVRTSFVRSLGVKVYVANPIFVEGEAIGSLSFGSKCKTKFDDEELSLIETVTNQVSIALKRKNMEEELSKTEERYKSLVENPNSIVMTVDKDLKITFINRFGLDFLGYTSKEIIGKSVLGTTIPLKDNQGRDLAEMAKNIIRHPEKYKTNVHENMLKSGKLVWVSWTNSARYDQNGDLVEILAVGNDITDLKEAEQRIQASLVWEATSVYTRSLIEASLDPLITVNVNGEITDANKATELVTGLSIQELIGSDFSNYFTEPQKAANGYKQVFTHGLIVDYPLAIKHKNGKITEVLFNASLYRDSAGKVKGVFAAARDITERKKMEMQITQRNSELAFERQRLYNVLESLPAMVCLLTPDHHVFFANRSFRKRFGESQGRHCYDYCFGNKEPCSFCETFRVLETGLPHHWEVKASDGSVIDAYDFPFTDVNGSPMILEMDLDITEKKRLEQQLKDSERLAAIGATAGMVGHDIRNPLQAIMNDTYLLKDELTSMPECKSKEGMAESIDSIEKNIGYINKIVADLQDYARQLKPECIDVNLSELVMSVFDPITIPDDLKLSIEIGTRFRIKSDPTLLRRILTNLIINAIQAMPNGGKLVVCASKSNDKAVLSVEDTGVGIPDGVKSKLFTPMMTTKSKGQGLGLAVVKRLVESLGGSIMFESEVGKGTKFTITFPLLQQKGT